MPPWLTASVPEMLPSERQLPAIAKHPVARFTPFAAVEVAEPVMFSARSETPPWNVDVEVLETASELIVVVPAESVPPKMPLPVAVKLPTTVEEA